jgi:hypothetical protein
VKANDKSSQGSSFSGFGASSFPGNFKSKDFEIHDSSIGKTTPVCDKSFSQLLGTKPEAKHRLLKERTQQYPKHVKHYGASSPIWPTRTEKGEAHQLVWSQEVVKKTYHKLGSFSR